MNFQTQCAKDAKESNYGNESYWEYLEQSALSHAEYFRKLGNEEHAEKVLKQSLSEALQGNDGE